MNWICLFFLCFTYFLNGAPVGNPSLPFLLQEGFFVPDKCWSNPQCAFLGDYLVQKKFRSCHSSSRLQLHNGELYGASEVGTVTWSIRERLNLQLQLGSGQFTWKWRQVGQTIRGKAHGGLIWGGDAKFIIFNVKDTLLAIDAQGGGWDWMTGPATVDGRQTRERASSLLRYWQLGIALTQQISFFSPYIGFAGNHTRLKVSHLESGTGRLHARYELGPFAGCSLSSGNKVLLNLEWRGWFEEGVSLSSQFRF